VWQFRFLRVASLANLRGLSVWFWLNPRQCSSALWLNGTCWVSIFCPHILLWSSSLRSFPNQFFWKGNLNLEPEHWTVQGSGLDKDVVGPTQFFTARRNRFEKNMEKRKLCKRWLMGIWEERRGEFWDSKSRRTWVNHWCRCDTSHYTEQYWVLHCGCYKQRHGQSLLESFPPCFSLHVFYNSTLNPLNRDTVSLGIFFFVGMYGCIFVY